MSSIPANEQSSVAKKRGRKTKQELLNIISGTTAEENNATEETVAKSSSSTKSNKKTVNTAATTTEIISQSRPRRGRKPNSSKIIDNINTINVASNFHSFGSKNAVLPSVILHLKCRITDTLQDNDYKFCDITHNNHLNFGLSSNETKDSNIEYSMLPQYEPLNVAVENSILMGSVGSEHDKNTVAPSSLKYQIRELNKKINHLDFILESQIEIKKSACFWCTEHFECTSIHIPKYCQDNVFYVYGNFCSLECAVAYLISNVKHKSTMMEQYTLLHRLYLDTAPNLQNRIKPAPEPRYILNKFMGNLSIEEYRSLHTLNRHFILLDKPIKKVSPEYHEEYSTSKI